MKTHRQRDRRQHSTRKGGSTLREGMKNTDTTNTRSQEKTREKREKGGHTAALVDLRADVAPLADGAHGALIAIVAVTVEATGAGALVVRALVELSAGGHRRGAMKRNSQHKEEKKREAARREEKRREERRRTTPSLTACWFARSPAGRPAGCQHRIRLLRGKVCSWWRRTPWCKCCRGTGGTRQCPQSPPGGTGSVGGWRRQAGREKRRQ